VQGSGPMVVETHISTLFFAGDRVYKLFKPVQTGFLDHRDVEARVAAVTTELESNRRFAPDVYLGTSDIAEYGELVDRMLIMRRLPTDRRLSALVDDVGFDDHLVRVARAVAVLHAQLPPVLDPVPLASAAGLWSFWESSCAEIAPSIDDVIAAAEFEQVHDLARDYLRHHESLFEARRRDGFVRDGHGDLIADDIFMLDDGPRILDCLAFDPAYRTADVLADVAFLVMDIEHLAGAARAARLMRAYCQFDDEHHSGSLAHHYVAYRAHVRAKVAVLRHRQGDPGSAGLARAFHRQALDHLVRGQPHLVLVGGAPGTGKTTLTEALADALNWSTLDSDTLRKDLKGIDHGDHRVDLHVDLYDEEATEATYSCLVRHAGALLAAGESVVLDATWARAPHRELARALASQHGATMIEIECVLDPGIAADRVEDRRERADDVSDATAEIARRLAAARDPWPSARRIDTREPPDTAVEGILRSVFDGD